MVNEFSPEDPNTIFMDYEISIRKMPACHSFARFVRYRCEHCCVCRGSRKFGQWVDVQRREIPESVKYAYARFLKKVVSISGH